MGNAFGNDCLAATISASFPPGKFYHFIASGSGFANHGSSVDFQIRVNGGLVRTANAIPGQTVVNTVGWSDIVPASGVVTVSMTPAIACGREELRLDLILF